MTGRYNHTQYFKPPGMKVMMGQKFTKSHQILHIIVILSHFMVSSGEPEAEILLRFKESLQNDDALSNWNDITPPCTGLHANWIGVFCNDDGVWGLRLENMGLGGIIDVEALAKLANLRSVSFVRNNFDGSLPIFTGMPWLKGIYVSENKFSGEIPAYKFQGMLSLKKLDLSNNQFSGPIPASVAALPRLVELMLENNHFDGEIPQFSAERLKFLNLSNNQLVGEIPPSLSTFDATSFSGNKDLCGAPLGACDKTTQLTIGAIITMSLLSVAAIIALVVVFFILRRRRQSVGGAAIASYSGTGLEFMDMEKMEVAPPAVSSKIAQRRRSTLSVKITFLKEGRDEFDMTDLLKASAEILGSGVFSSTYKALLNTGQVLVVKRFRHMNNLSKEEFHDHMTSLGRLRHPNLLPVVGFYYKKAEKLFVMDYVERSSLAFHLHGKRSQGRPDWSARMNIIKGVAKGLVYLHDELPSLTTPHGHLKSSNVLLDKSYTGILTDYGLVPMVDQEHVQEYIISYKSPEYKQTRRISKKTDVWALGILILEILTGKFPSGFLQQGHGSDIDMQMWVETVVWDQNSDDVLDSEMEKTSNSRYQMMKLLKIGLVCCQEDVNSRPSIKEAMQQIDEISEELE